MAHTPTPWKVNNKAFGDTDMVGAELEIRSKWGLVAKASTIHEDMVIAEANARFIVQAVNAYDDMLAACETGLELAKIVMYQHPDCEVYQAQKEIIEAAIAKATK